MGKGYSAILNHKMAQDILSADGQAEEVGVGEGSLLYNLPIYSPQVIPILEILAAQMVSLAITQNQGIEAEKFIHASKVTTTE